MTDSSHLAPPTSFKISLIGDDCQDVYEFGRVDRISPEAPVPVFQRDYAVTKAGMARNVLQNLSALGCDVRFWHANTSVKTRLIDQRSQQHIVRIDDDHVSTALAYDADMHRNVDAVVISDYAKGTVNYDLIANILDGFDGPVFVDTKKNDLGQFRAAWVKINESEYQQRTSEAVNAVVTLGSRGAMLIEQGHETARYDAMPVEVSDVTGAGDTFLAALTYFSLLHGRVQDAMPYAMAAAAVTVQHLGCYAPTLKEIQHAIAR